MTLNLFAIDAAFGLLSIQSRIRVKSWRPYRGCWRCTEEEDMLLRQRMSGVLRSDWLGTDVWGSFTE